MVIRYSCTQLLALSARSSCRVPRATYNKLQLLRICSKAPTHRGTVAGKSRERSIPTRITDREPVITHHTSITKGNLVKIPLLRSLTYISTKNLSFCSLNTRSIKNKTVSLSDFISSHDYDVVALTETWLGSTVDRSCLGELIPTGYEIKHVPRQSNRHGGGVAVIYKERLSLKVLDSTKNQNITQFEFMECNLNIGPANLHLSVVYRPPPSKGNGMQKSTFFDEWPLFLEKLATNHHETLLVGDLNFHLDTEDNPDTRRFNSILDACGLKQHVNVPTHIRGHTLDVVITKDVSTIITDMSVLDPCLFNDKGNSSGDHFAVCFNTAFMNQRM